MRQKKDAPYANVADDAGEHWAFMVFFAFLLVLAGIALWLSFSGHTRLAPANSMDYPAEDAVLSLNEPIQAIPYPQGLDQHKAALGYRLFYEPRLSGDDSTSCATCHDLNTGGVDNKVFSVGVGGVVGEINTLTVFNAVNNIVWFWDGRATTLQGQLDGPILSPSEMNSDWQEIIGKLKRDQSYVSDFSQAYDDGITEANIKDALVTFERTLVTPDSPFDRYLRGDYYAISDEEKMGYQLFKDYGCSSCHQGVNVGGNLFQVFGVVRDYFEGRDNLTYADYGRFNVTGKEIDRHRFRVPSLRNVALTAPYFHDGSASTLEQAVYIMAEYQLGRNIPDEDVALIVRFLEALTGVPAYQDSKG